MAKKKRGGRSKKGQQKVGNATNVWNKVNVEIRCRKRGVSSD